MDLPALAQSVSCPSLTILVVSKDSHATLTLQLADPDLAILDYCCCTAQEVDFQQEARHIQDFANYLDASGMRRSATCPFVYKMFSSRR